MSEKFRNMGATEQEVNLRNQPRPANGDIADAGAQAQRIADDVGDKAAKLSTQASESINTAMNSAGQQLQDLAQTVRERAPAEQVGNIADTTARALERGASYLQEKDVSALSHDLEEFIRQHPMEAVLVGLGIGFLAARSMRG